MPIEHHLSLQCLAGNTGRLIGPKPLRPRHPGRSEPGFSMMNRVRDLAMFNLAIDSKLRGCDLVSLG